MEVKGKQIEEGQIVRIDCVDGKRFAGFCYKPVLIQKVMKIPFTEGYVIGITHIDLKKLDLSLNPVKILETFENVVYKVDGIPTVFKDKEIENIFVLDTIEDGITEAENQEQNVDEEPKEEKTDEEKSEETSGESENGEEEGEKDGQGQS